MRHWPWLLPTPSHGHHKLSDQFQCIAGGQITIHITGRPEHMWRALERVPGIWFAIWTVIFRRRVFCELAGGESVFACLLFVHLVSACRGWEMVEIWCVKNEQLSPFIVCQQTNTRHANQREIVWCSVNIWCCYFSLGLSHSSPFFAVHRHLLKGQWFSLNIIPPTTHIATAIVFLWPFVLTYSTYSAHIRRGYFWALVFSHLSYFNSGHRAAFMERD